jgi:hypothetical protein
MKWRTGKYCEEVALAKVKYVKSICVAGWNKITKKKKKKHVSAEIRTRRF